MRVLLPESFAARNVDAVCPFGACRHEAEDLSSHLTRYYKDESRSRDETCQENSGENVWSLIPRLDICHGTLLNRHLSQNHSLE